ncbi:MAG: succinate dehydrogenase/fumarate reductase flavoprotein subunit, partial [Firmicutes bacterium]|nr:succinate dehydrogenase/fumarate reductase flavoprotein subunit [Bacillota bacterium]
MYQDKEMLASIKKVEAKRAENIKLDPRRMTAEEKEKLLATYHPDYKEDQFKQLVIGPNKGEKV